MSSFDRPADSDIEPSPWVVRFAHLIEAGGTVLDLACGDGRHARFFAHRGHPVTAVDVDISGVRDLQQDASVHVLKTDLEDGAWPFTDIQFQGIVVANYLHRPHFRPLVDALAPDGVLLFDTFGAGNEKLGHPRNPDFLLQPGELLAAFLPTLNVVAYEWGQESDPRPAVRQRICAIKSGEPVGLDPEN